MRHASIRSLYRLYFRKYQWNSVKCRSSQGRRTELSWCPWQSSLHQSLRGLYKVKSSDTDMHLLNFFQTCLHLFSREPSNLTSGSLVGGPTPRLWFLLWSLRSLGLPWWFPVQTKRLVTHLKIQAIWLLCVHRCKSRSTVVYVYFL